MMRRSAFTLFVTIYFIQVCNAINCYTCSDETCPTPEHWVIERCSPESTFCYKFKNNDHRVYALGCSTHERCHDIGGYVKNTECNTCDSDACNGHRMYHTIPPSGSASSIGSIVTTLFILIVNLIVFK